MSVHQLKPDTERKPGPYSRERTCDSCNAHLSSYNPGDLCATCNGGDWPGSDLRTQQVEGDREDVLQEALAA